MSVDRQIAGLRSHVDAQVAALKAEVQHLTRLVTAIAAKVATPPREWPGVSSDITITAGLLNMRHIVVNTAAHNFNLPVMSPAAFIVITNDPTSTDDITVKDSLAATVDTITPGATVPYAMNSSGTVEPL